MRLPNHGHLLGALLPIRVSAALSSVQQIEINAKPSPEACIPGRGPADWSLYPKPERLAVCPESVLLDYSLYNAFEDAETDNSIRTCTLGNANTEVNFLVESSYVDPGATNDTDFGPTRRRSAASSTGCGASSSKQSKFTAHLSSWGGSGNSINNDPKADVVLATESLANHIKTAPAICDQKTILFTCVRGTLVGLYSGSQIDTGKTLESLLPILVDDLKVGSTSRRTIEICGEGPASDLIGVVADATGDFAAVQAIMKTWNEGSCVANAKGSETKQIDGVSVWSYTSAPVVENRDLKFLNPRAECRSIVAEAAETCETLAKRCGLGTAAFKSFNKAITDCSNISGGQPVCCSSGTLPSIKPGVGSDGICASYVVVSGDYCQAIATKHGITLDELYEFNMKTWAWDGCENLQPYTRICVSEGNPPLPATVLNAECGPTRNGTQSPTNDESLADLNPCPLNACCSKWGTCGTTNEFCLVTESTTGNPGTTGCISNCGQELTNNGQAPTQLRKIGYFEGWNYERPCLNMDVLDIDSSYTHVHFSFGEISSDIKVVIPDNSKEQFEAFKNASNFPAKKILAIGGAAFSNGGSNSGLFRKAVSLADRQKFADNVVQFVADNQLDGIDFDWEYPGATDIEGSVPGQEDDGDNYYELLKLVREKLPEGKSLSLAAPASYWYLKGFPIKKMAPYLDYIIYMTYDLHGQWDVGSEWASPGCPAGNCLRSYVNSTETTNALVMITKAGVESHKIVVGVSSFGTYLGTRNESPAKKGRCTNTAGFLADFEINEIIAKGGAIKSWYDEDSDSDYLIYEATEWVGYMSKVTKSRRMRNYKNLNFGGTTDWAIDL